MARRGGDEEGTTTTRGGDNDDEGGETTRVGRQRRGRGDNDAATHQHPEPPPRATARGVGTGSNGAMMTNDNGRTQQWRGEGERRGPPKKNGPGDVIDVSWATGKFYFFLVTNDVFRYKLYDNDETTTQHPPGRGRGGRRMGDRKSTRLNSSHLPTSRMPSSA